MPYYKIEVIIKATEPLEAEAALANAIEEYGNRTNQNFSATIGVAHDPKTGEPCYEPDEIGGRKGA